MKKLFYMIILSFIFVGAGYIFAEEGEMPDQEQKMIPQEMDKPVTVTGEGMKMKRMKMGHHKGEAEMVSGIQTPPTEAVIL
jgi:hypothetical protein